MMEEFPVLIDTQVALARAKLNTGHVLDESFLIAINISQRVFTVYPNVKDALQAALAIVKNHPHIECWIQNANKDVLHYIHRYNIGQFSESQKPL